MSVVFTPSAPATSTALVKVINPLATSVVSAFEDSYHRRLAYNSGLSGTSALRVAGQARLVCCARDTELSIWRILQRREAPPNDNTLEEPTSGEWEKVLDIELNVHTNITASAISDNGRWLVVSDLYETRLFALDSDVSIVSLFGPVPKDLSVQQNNGGLKPKRIRDFSSILQASLPQTATSTGGSAFYFSPDSQKLAMATAMSSFILVIDLSGETPRVLRRFGHHRAKNLVGGDRIVKKSRTMNSAKEEKAKKAFESEQNDDVNKDDIIRDGINEDETGPCVPDVSRMSISTDGQWLATTDDLARTYIFNLDSVQVSPSYLAR